MAKVTGHLTIRIEPEKKQKLKDLADTYGITSSQMVAYMIDYFEKKKPEAVTKVVRLPRSNRPKADS